MIFKDINMADKMINYDSADSVRPSSVMIDKITHLTKEKEDNDVDEDVTLIHLVNGTVLRSHDSIRTLQARINND